MKDQTPNKTPYNQTPEGRFTGSGHVRGYSGLVHTAVPISRFIHPNIYFVEHFAGLGRITRQVQDRFGYVILNDLSAYACEHNLNNFPLAQITQQDFITSIKRWDSRKTTNFFDPPWRKSEYENGCHGRAVCTMEPREYYRIIFEILPKLEGDWFVTGSKNNTALKKSGYPYKLIEAEDGAKIMGGLIKTAIISNKEFVEYVPPK